MPILSAFLCGLMFGTGLVVSGMTDTAKVLGFLDVLAIPKAGWDPTLARRRGRPVLADVAASPTRTGIDRPLIVGAVLFGAGWGLVGLCPGPAIINLATLSPPVLLFVTAMIAGMAAHAIWRRRVRHLASLAAADG